MAAHSAAIKRVTHLDTQTHAESPLTSKLEAWCSVFRTVCPSFFHFCVVHDDAHNGSTIKKDEIQMN